MREIGRKTDAALGDLRERVQQIKFDNDHMQSQMEEIKSSVHTEIQEMRSTLECDLTCIKSTLEKIVKMAETGPD